MSVARFRAARWTLASTHALGSTPLAASNLRGQSYGFHAGIGITYRVCLVNNGAETNTCSVWRNDTA